jgi:hypothetical protein
MTTPLPSTESNSPEVVSRKATLGEFIDVNSKLVTSIAAFAALTAFSSQMDNGDIKFIFPGLTFLAAVLLTIELSTLMPPRPLHWRLELFSQILGLMTLLMGAYWFSKFPALWGSVVVFAISMVIFLGIPAVLAHFLTKLIKIVAAKLFNREIGANAILRTGQIIFITCALCGLLGLSWNSKRLARHPVKIHIPTLSENGTGKM